MTVERRTLESPPSLLPLYGRALAGSLLPLGRAGELGDDVLELEGAEVERDRLADYARVCGFRLGERLPATYPHVLAFPLAMELMTRRSFPFPLLGLVHVENRIEQRRPLGASERLDLRVWAEGLRPHPRGRQLDVVCEASAGSEVAWLGRSTYLRRGAGASERGERERPDAEPPSEPVATWRVPGDVGRRYAGVSGDRNPIHMHDLAARAFGMPGAIAHGMWTKARCLAAFEGRLPGAFSIEVRFGAPLGIPATVRLATRAEQGGGFALAVLGRRPERPHLTGSIVPL